MIIPIRCFTCGKVLAHLWEPFQEKLQNENIEIINNSVSVEMNTLMQKKEGDRMDKVGHILNDLGVHRYCCRARFLGTNDKTKLI